MTAFPQVAAVVPVHNGRELTLTLLASLERVTYPALEIIVVDDGSTDGTAEAVADRFPRVRVVTGDGTLWWSGGINAGVGEALSRGAAFILTINNDIVVEPGFLEPLLESAGRTPRSIVTSKIHDQSDRSAVSSFGGTIDWLVGEIRDVTSRRDRCDFTALRSCDWVNGSSTLIPAVVFREVGLLDEKGCPQYHGDAEFCLRARQHGYRLLADPRSVVYRRTEVSTGNRALDTDNLRSLFRSVRSPFYFRANWRLYRDHCPYRPFLPFLAIRYARLFYSLFRRRFVDRTRRRSVGSRGHR